MDLIKAHICMYEMLNGVRFAYEVIAKHDLHSTHTRGLCDLG